MDTGDVAHTLMSALTRVQNMLAPPPNTAGDAALAASLAPPDTSGDAALAASLVNLLLVGGVRNIDEARCFLQSLCGNKNDTRDPNCHMQIKEGVAWMGLKRSEMGVTGDSINTASGL